MKTLLLLGLCLATAAAFTDKEVRSLAFKLLEKLETRQKNEGDKPPMPKPPPAGGECVKTTIFDSVDPEKCIPLARQQFLEKHGEPIVSLDEIPVANVEKTIEKIRQAVAKMIEGVNGDLANAPTETTGRDGVAMLRTVYRKYIMPVEKLLNETTEATFFGLMKGVIAGTRIPGLSKEQNEPGCLGPETPGPKQVACAMVKAGLMEEAITASITLTMGRLETKGNYKICMNLYEIAYADFDNLEFSKLSDAVRESIECMAQNIKNYVGLFKNTEGAFEKFGDKPLPRILAVADMLFAIGGEVAGLKYAGKAVLDGLAYQDSIGGSGDSYSGYYGSTGASTGSTGTSTGSNMRSMDSHKQQVKILLRELAQKFNLEY